MKKNKLTTIKTSLPYALYKIDERFFKVDKYTKIRFIKIKTEPNRIMSNSQNIELIRDRWGISAYSKVEILTNKILNNNEDAKKYILKILNKFIKLYKFYDTSAIHLVPLNPEDLFDIDKLYDGKGEISLTPAGGITIANPLLNHDISNKVEEAILNNKDFPFSDELLLNSQQFLYQGDFRHSILESIIALEIVISQLIYMLCKNKNIQKNQAKKYIEEIGISGNIDFILKILIDKNYLPEEVIFNKCKEGITLRNNIVHEGEKNISINQAKDTLEATKAMIKFTYQYTQKMEKHD